MLIRYALRTMRRRMTVTVAAVGTLAIGVGITASVFRVVDALLLSPPAHVLEPERVVHVLSDRNYVDFLTTSTAETLDVAAYSRSELSLGSGAAAAPVVMECVTPGYFGLLGVEAVLGRSLGPAEGALSHSVVLSYGFWQRHYGGTPQALGDRIQIGDTIYVVDGVAPRNFRGIETEPVDLWALITASPENCSFTGTNLLASSAGSWLKTIARIRKGVTLEQSEAEVASLKATRSSVRSNRVLPPRHLEPILGSDNRTKYRSKTILALLLGGSLTVFLIACFNVVGLLSISAVERRHEVAMRIQLGATQLHLIRQFFVETFLLAVIGALASVVVFSGTSFVLSRFFPILLDHQPNIRLVGVVLGCTIAAGSLGMMALTAELTRCSVVEVLRGSQSVLSPRSRLRGALLIGEVALAFALAVAAGLFVQSLENVQDEIGFDVERLIVANADLQRSGYSLADSQLAFQNMMERASRITGVRSVSISGSPILDSGGASITVLVQSASRGEKTASAYLNTVSPGYFSTIGTRITRGQPIGTVGGTSGRPVAVVSEGLARELWLEEEDALGECLLIGTVCLEVVGISESRRHVAISRSSQELFVPLNQASLLRVPPLFPRLLLIRTDGSVQEVLETITNAVRADDNLPFVSVAPLGSLVDAQTRSWRLGASLFTVFAAIALILATIGVYGMLTFSVRQRTSEIGLMIALGAKRGDILRLVTGQGLTIIVVGWTIGIAASLGLGRMVQRLLFEVAPTDMTTFATTSLIIFGVGLVACIVPAARAARLDPSAALRES